MIELNTYLPRPFGKGERPDRLLDFFNWGAFALPEIWGIWHGCWMIVLASTSTYLVSLFVLVELGSDGGTSPIVYYGFLALAQLVQGVVRLWAGMKANHFYWNRMAKGRGNFGLVPKEITFKQFFAKQRQWALVGMIVMLSATLFGGAWNFTVMEASGGQSDAFLSTGQDLAWALAFLASAYYIALQGTLLMAPQRGFIYLTNDRVVSVDGKILEGKQAITALNATSHTEAKRESEATYVQVNQPEPPSSADDEVYAFPLANGQILPVLGMGTYKMEPGSATTLAIKYALDAGYRSFDTAAFYKNEQSIAQAIKQYGISRDDVFITSKVWNIDQGYVNTIRAFEKSLTELETDHLDMYLIHWPIEKTMRSTWRALEHLYQAGKVRAIGVCNFEVAHLDQLLMHAEIAPMVNQIELHPRFTREELVLFCWNHGMLVQSWAPLIRGAVTVIPELARIARAHGKTEAQVALRWGVQHNFAVIPKSTNPQRIIENAQIFDFQLTSKEMSIIDSLNRDMRVGPDPAEYSWHSG